MPEKIELSINVVNAVLTYLGKQSFEQVAPLINAIQQEASPQIPAPAVVSEDE
jgi:hypothetical protein